MFTRTTLLLKPLQSGASGHARLWTENGRWQLHLTARGVPGGKATLYAYRRGEAPEQLCHADASGETVMAAEGFREADALMLIGGAPPKPLLAGLCGRPDADALMEVQSAAQALCRRLGPLPPAQQPKPPDPPPAPASPAHPPVSAPPSIPREVFLPAIDPLPYVVAADGRAEPLLPPPKPSGPPADRLRPLRWPRGFEALRPYFEKNLPRALFPMPGWRFVQAAQGLWIGVQREDGWARRVAYAREGRTPPASGGPWRAIKGGDGRWYQLLVQEFSAG